MMPRIRPAAMRCSWLVGLVLMTSARPVLAETPTSRKAAAEGLYDRGIATMREGRFAEACPLFEQSEALEHGIGTLLNLAQCYEFLGRLASAWVMYREAASAAQAEGQGERAQIGKERAARLERLLPRLNLQVAADNTMPGFAIELNGAALPNAAWQIPQPVDPGDNVIVARAPGYASFTIHVTAPSDPTPLAVSIASLVAAPDLAPPAAATAADGVQGAKLQLASQSPQIDGASGGTWQRPLGLLSGGLGLAAIGVGSYFGLHAISRNDAAQKLCPGAGSSCADPRGVAFSDQANSAAQTSNGFLIGGLVLTGVGVVLLLIAPSHAKPDANLRADVRPMNLSLSGTF